MNDKQTYESVRESLTSAHTTIALAPVITELDQLKDKIAVTVIHIKNAFKYLLFIDVLPKDILKLMFEVIEKCIVCLTLDSSQMIHSRVTEIDALIKEMQDLCKGK